MDPLPIFPLFPDPVSEDVIEQSTAACGVCGRRRGFLYTGPHYGGSAATDDLRICPWCISGGTAAGEGITFNDATIYPYFDSTPQMNAGDQALVEQRTPGFVTWQGNHWLMCCGRACVYLGEAKPADLKGRWEVVVRSMFEAEGRSKQEIDEFIESMSQAEITSVYVFECQVCRSPQAYWDCD